MKLDFRHILDKYVQENVFNNVACAHSFHFKVSVLCDNAGLFCICAASADLLHSGCEEVVVRSTFLLPW